MRTQEQILARYNERQPKDFLGFETSEYLGAMTFDTAKPLLKPDSDFEKVKSEWVVAYPDRATTLVEMKTYMTFAFGKAHDQRGISASRSIMHYVGWTWLIGDDELSEKLDEAEDYDPYGIPMLRYICEHYGWNPKECGDE